MFEKLTTTYAPVRGFLVQSSEDAYHDFLAEALQSTPFIHSLSVARFSAEHAKSLVSFISEGIGESRYFIAFFSVFSGDAAQILLKALEEPDENTTIILCTPYPYTVPMTIRSRVQLVFGDRLRKSSTTLSDRNTMLEFVKKEFGSDDEDAAVRRAKAVELLDDIEHFVRDNVSKSSIVYEGKKMLFLANMPTKFVLEYVVSTVL